MNILFYCVPFTVYVRLLLANACWNQSVDINLKNKHTGTIFGLLKMDLYYVPLCLCYTQTCIVYGDMSHKNGEVGMEKQETTQVDSIRK